MKLSGEKFLKVQKIATTRKYFSCHEISSKKNHDMLKICYTKKFDLKFHNSLQHAGFKKLRPLDINNYLSLPRNFVTALQKFSDT